MATTTKGDRVLARLVTHWLVLAVALAVVAGLLDSVEVSGGVFGLLGASLLFGLVDAILGPILRLLTLPLTLITLGLFTLVVNAILLFVAAGLSNNPDRARCVDHHGGLHPARLGARHGTTLSVGRSGAQAQCKRPARGVAHAQGVSERVPHQEPAMIVNDPDTLQFFINVFFVVAAASVALAFAALALGIRDLRGPVAASSAPAPSRHLGEVTSAPTSRAA
jgi:uncharacterized membrane protein YvlD (DUF360 family)